MLAGRAGSFIGGGTVDATADQRLVRLPTGVRSHERAWTPAPHLLCAATRPTWVRLPFASAVPCAAAFRNGGELTVLDVIIANAAVTEPPSPRPTCVEALSARYFWSMGMSLKNACWSRRPEADFRAIRRRCFTRRWASYPRLTPRLTTLSPRRGCITRLACHRPRIGVQSEMHPARKRIQEPA